jgi:predicted nuclease of predicted toxin-antitoxin system
MLLNASVEQRSSALNEIDSNLSWRLVKLLENNFPESLHVNRTGLNQPASDRQIFDYAKQHSYTIVTCDDDFHHLSLQLGFPPKIILIKMGNLSSMNISQLMRNHKADLIEFPSQSETGVLELIRL